MATSGEPKVSLWQRLLLALPSTRRNGDGDVAPKPSIGERFRNAVIKAETEATVPAVEKPRTVDELEEAVRHADDTERLIGLIAAPLVAAVGLVVVSNQISRDPSHTSVYHGLELMFLVMAMLLMAAAWFRKRLFMGILLALIGLAIFNLHYWELGIPFLLGGSWYLVRAYRAQRALKDAVAGQGAAGTGRASDGSPPAPSKRYTPPTPSKRQKPPQDDRRAG
jgi:hypothetical protein